MTSKRNEMIRIDIFQISELPVNRYTYKHKNKLIYYQFDIHL